jgi:hypothetical protein
VLAVRPDPTRAGDDASTGHLVASAQPIEQPTSDFHSPDVSRALARSSDVATIQHVRPRACLEGIFQTTRTSERKRHGGWARAHSMPRNGANTDASRARPHRRACGARASNTGRTPRAPGRRGAIPVLPWTPWGDSAPAPRSREVPVRPAPPTHERPVVSPTRDGCSGTGAVAVLSRRSWSPGTPAQAGGGEAK